LVHTSLEVKLDVRIFLLLVTIVVRTALDTIFCACQMLLLLLLDDGGKTYTCTLRSSSSAVGFWCETTTLSAMSMPRLKATVVKKPNTFCIRTSDECILTCTRQDETCRG
jgi:hypothetical protein